MQKSVVRVLIVLALGLGLGIGVLAWTGPGAAPPNGNPSPANSGWTDGGASVYLTTSGDSVGIGTTGPGQKLDVVGHIRALGSGDKAFIASNSAVGGKAVSLFAGGAEASLQYDSTGTFQIISNTKANIQNATFAGTARFLIDTSGNVGVGMTPGAYKLDVNGTIHGMDITCTDCLNAGDIAADAVGSSELASSGVTLGTYGNATNVPQITVDADGRITAASNVGITGGSGTPGGVNGNVQFNNSGVFGGTNNLHWDSTNNRLGIGTSSPWTRLHIAGGGAGSLATAPVGIYIDVDGGGHPRLELRGAGTPYIDFSSTTAPDYESRLILYQSPTRLTVEGADLYIGGQRVCRADGTGCPATASSGWTDDGSTVRLTTGTDNVGIGGATGVTIDLAIGDSDTGLQQQGDGELALYTNNGERVRINTLGNIGIGTVSPLTRLESYGTDAGSIVHYPGQSRGGLWALSSQRVAFATTGSSDALVFGYGGTPVTSGNFVERMRINNSTGRVDIGGDLYIGNQRACRADGTGCPAITVVTATYSGDVWNYATCPAGYQLISGGFYTSSGTPVIRKSYPSGSNEWGCHITGTGGSWNCYAVCIDYP
ncbi:MAG: hypothetical protein HY475_00540 [Candidatus Terrybacteria bacterium]|nr:hypothetical protein [Candidatus Terrybacteria bacterium]